MASHAQAEKIPVPRGRRTNVDRAAGTRQQVLDAVVHGLHAHGYSALTNSRIIETAGISSGAMMHHFPSRQALLEATVKYAYGRLSDFRMSKLEELQPGLPRFRAIIDLAWATARMPDGLAVNEVRIGSRSDPQVARAVSPIMTEIATDYARFVGRQVRAAGLKPSTEIQSLSALTAMSVRSLSIDRFTYPSLQMVQNVLLGLRTMREDIIGRQLGDHMRIDPSVPNIEI
jgi:AcrR family transcriptional regulator